MNKVKFSFYFIFVSVLTLITILIILAQNSYTNLVTTPKSNIESNTLLSVINPTLDLDVLSQIESRQESSGSGVSIESGLIILTTPIPTPTSIPKTTPTSTISSPIITPTPTPTPTSVSTSNDQAQLNNELNKLNTEYSDLLNQTP